LGLAYHIIIANKYPAGKQNEKMENSKLVILILQTSY